MKLETLPFKDGRCCGRQNARGGVGASMTRTVPAILDRARSKDFPVHHQLREFHREFANPPQIQLSRSQIRDRVHLEEC